MHSFRAFVPPAIGVNRLYRVNQRTAQPYKTKEAKDYASSTFDLLRLERRWPRFPPLSDGIYFVSVEIANASHRHDVDAQAKLLLDVIKEVIEIDDRHFYLLGMVKIPSEESEEIIHLSVDVGVARDRHHAFLLATTVANARPYHFALMELLQ